MKYSDSNNFEYKLLVYLYLSIVYLFQHLVFVCVYYCYSYYCFFPTYYSLLCFFNLLLPLTGYPEPKVTWSKNKEVLSEKDSHYKISFKDNTSTLKVKESVTEDTAEYTLTGTNDAGSTSQSVTVNIKPKPQPVEEQTEKVEETSVEEK